MSQELKELYEFGSFRLDVAEHTLSRSDGSINGSLPDKAFKTLLYLVRNSGHLVTKDDLLQAVWPDTIVEENNLDKSIHAIRRVLGETRGEHKYIETVLKYGYRFVADVTRIECDERSTRPAAVLQNLKEVSAFPTPVPQHRLSPSGVHAIVNLAEWRQNENNAEVLALVSETATPTNLESAETDHSFARQIKRQKPLVASVLAALLFGVIGLGYYFFFAGKASSGANVKRSIAVLPIKPINSANRDEIYEVGIADSLIHKLSSMKGFIVRPLSATRQYAGIEQDAIAAGREQKVDYVLASNYQLADGKIKITAQLFDVVNGQIEETYKSEKDAANLFAMQDAIAGEVGDKLLARFGITVSGSAAKRGTTNEEAYRLYLQGMILVDQRKARKAIENFEQAVTLDPNYALAWAGLAHAHRAAVSQVNGVDVNEEHQKTKEAFTKALELDPNLSEAYSAMCAFYENDFAANERACRRAMELNPNSSLAHNLYSSLLVGRGRFDEAIAEIKTAIELDPTSYFNQRIYANDLYFARRYEEAVAQYKRLIEMDEEKRATYQWLIRTLEAQGNESEAFEWFLKSLTLQKEDNETIQRFKTAYQKSGWQGVLLEREREGEGNYFRRAGLYARLGNKDKAFEYLEKSYQTDARGMGSLQVEPQLDSLRDDPRFAELVKLVSLR